MFFTKIIAAFNTIQFTGYHCCHHNLSLSRTLFCPLFFQYTQYNTEKSVCHYTGGIKSATFLSVKCTILQALFVHYTLNFGFSYRTLNHPKTIFQLGIPVPSCSFIIHPLSSESIISTCFIKHFASGCILSHFINFVFSSLITI